MAASVTLKDIAREASLSISAVSKALSDAPDISPETRSRVQMLSRKLNYRPKSRETGHAHKENARRVAFVLVDQRTTDQVFLEVLAPLTRQSASHNIELEIVGISGDEAHRLTNIAQRQDMMLLYGRVNRDLFDHAAQLCQLCVCMGNLGGDPLAMHPAGHVVSSDMVAMGQLATRTLLSSGHQRIAFIANSTTLGFWYERWQTGYRYALLDAGIAISPELNHLTGKGQRTGERAATALHALSDPPTGFVIPDPRTAAGFLREANRLDWEICADAVIVGGTEALAETYETQHLPLLAIDNAAIAQACLELLTHPLGVASVVNVPFKALNLPKP